MSDLAWNWVALAVTVVLFAGLAWLSRRRHVNFSIRVIVATALGIVVGVAFKEHVEFVAAFGEVWAHAISAIVVPLLVFSVISSITGLGESVRLRSIGLKTVFFLLLNTFTAATITLGLAIVFKVGSGFSGAQPAGAHHKVVPGVLDTLVGLFPSNFVLNWSQNQVVPIVIFALILAIAFNEASRTKRGAQAVQPFKVIADAGNVVLSKATQIIVGFTPYATLSLIAAAVSNSVVSALVPLVSVLVVAYIALILQLFIVQPVILSAAAHLNPIHFFKAFGPAGVVAFTSESSIGTIPVTVRQLKRGGVPDDVASFVASLGANLGMPGCAGVWPVLLAVFAVNAQGLNYSFGQYLLLIVLALLVSIGTVGVPGTATVTATALFASAGLPVSFIAVTQPISQIVDMGRTAVNVAGAANTAFIVAASEHELDKDLYYQRKLWDDEDDLGSQPVASAAEPNDQAVSIPVAASVSAADSGASGEPSANAAAASSAAAPASNSVNLLSLSPSAALEGTGGEACGVSDHGSSKQ
ncbi:dicarboxylate/amino acid:cation symporter [Bifidobacterium tibiigranuli]|jgi:Na+/H+-dicarboxylate symporter|uniref:dicarboxylate/amino acid:cation symporter n=1 Tax=Bifidobacterium tibiigranuli TaxID=2172043 RepID=UPI0023566DA0|nr:dicarboxylate/amino acid:cation symporter [Bifidobacterium tibiigranuli]MCI1211419.1 dicarboxylate/amino acid:cation symporter [Bifidobacterium tibiigranuli]MCI1221255.1 dicarboxylate/amino acid:cation symporter [Bifidobacterium tibiigranuli]